VSGDRNVVAQPVAPKVADDLGKGSPLRRRNPTSVDATEAARTEYYGSGRDIPQNAILRSAARRGHDGDMDPTKYLTGAE
jgi:hypothetical protein